MPIEVPTPLPSVPNRALQGEAFSNEVDAYHIGIKLFSEEMVLVVNGMNDAVVTIGEASDAAVDAADRAEAAAAFKASVALASWTALAALTGSYAGQSAAVFGDGGTHTDPVIGGTVDNTGIYGWSVSPAGWRWISDGAGASVAWGDITGKPSTFAPSAHTHIIANITGLQDALDSKVASSSLAEAVRDAIGAALVAGDGITITVDDGADTITIEAEGGGGEMVYPGSGIAVSTGSAWGSPLAVPSGSLVGTTANQTLTNKTLGSGTTLSGGTITAGPSVSDSGTVTADSVGFRGTPRQTGSNRTLTANDNGKLVSLTGDATIPNSLPIGFSCIIYNNNSSNRTVWAGSGVTLRLAGSATTGSRTIGQRGLCSVTTVASGETVISGNIW